MRKTPWAWVIAAALAGVVGWSLFNQLHRPTTPGERVRAALANSTCFDRIAPAPIVMDFVPGDRQGMITVELGGTTLALARDVQRVELVGEVEILRCEQGLDEKPVQVVTAQRGYELARGGTLTLKTGAQWTLHVIGPGYTILRTHGAGGIRTLTEKPLDPPMQAALERAITPDLRWNAAAAGTIAQQRAAMAAQSEFDLFQELLAADAAVLARAESADVACRRALALLLLPRPQMALRWPADRAYALTTTAVGPKGDACIRVLGFNEMRQAWDATVLSQPTVSPADLRRIIDGLVPRP